MASQIDVDVAVTNEDYGKSIGTYKYMRISFLFSFVANISAPLTLT
jgi:hypothetical protein